MRTGFIMSPRTRTVKYIKRRLPIVAKPPLRDFGTESILNYMVQYSEQLNQAFAAVSDPTRRGILERLGRGDASISELAADFSMTLTGIKKHVQVLEEAGLVATEKVGRVRTCRAGPRRLADEASWIEQYQEMLEARLNRLAAFLEHTKAKPS